ncbi:globin domain-containing protein [Streptomyces sp. NPDC093707]|uniref:globin domain-containing protein n=1 Tax=Streptomyces sp. NPDC093707 TaxID=3154984 RepID=UPI00344D626F
MDAPTTTSADSGSPDGNRGDWGWFTPPAKKPSGDQQERQNNQDGRQSTPGEGNEPGERPESERLPGRPVNPVRPVGTAAGREREPEPQRVPRWVPRQGPPAPWEAARQPGTAARPERPAPAVPRPEPEREPEPVHEPAGWTPFDGVGPFGPHASEPASLPSAPVDSPRPTAPAAPSAPSAPTPAPAPTPPPAPAPAPTPAPAPPAAGPSLAALETLGSSDAAASPDAVLIRRTLAEIEPIADKVTAYFYALLFVRHPDLRALFPASMDTQRDRLFKALLTTAKHIDNSEVLGQYLAHLGRGHRKYGTLSDHYPAVGECLLSALSRYAPASWGPEAEGAWVRSYTALSQFMIDAAAEDEAVAPAWWQAEVVAHELRTSDTAVVTVRPDQPYPFRAGQYTSLETPWWPRVWRHYSFASAPRSDGLLSFHVKAVPAGWVSNALVHRARPGDVLRIGGPTGSMTVDHTTGNGLLCVGGGTGIAPIKALIEDIAGHGARRPVEVFYGARSDHDLYDIDTMLRLEQAHPWLSVRPVVADGPATRGGPGTLTGQLPDAVRQYGPYREYDAYLSGPPGLIRSGVEALVGVGIPTERIRHDSIDELVPTGD